MLSEDLIEIQVEQFLEFYKKHNPIRDIAECFSLWVESKDFQEEDSKKIWEKVLTGKKDNGSSELHYR